MYNNLLHLFLRFFVDSVDNCVDYENRRDCPRHIRGTVRLLAICGQCGQ
jgi:hypothetical protein